MDTVVTFTVYERYHDLSSVCFSALSDAEQTLTEHGSSVIYASENGQTVALNDVLTALTKQSLIVSELTDGAYDLTVAPLVSLWNVKQAAAPPNETEISTVLASIGYEKLIITENTVTFADLGMGIDFGSVGKGWAGDKIAETLTDRGITAGIIDLGGNIRVFGENPQKKDGFFLVGIKDPFDTSSLIGTVRVKNTNVITSGSYERFFEYDGEIYHHILDANTGYPAQSGVASVSVICCDGAMADMLSTALFIVGKDKGLDVLNTLAATYPDLAAVFVLSDGEIVTFNTDMYGAVFK